jgi:hypothetical protein
MNIDERTGKPKIILDLCGGTGAWSRPYKEAGYDVRLITLPEYDVTKVDFNLLTISFQPMDKCEKIIAYEYVYGILAAPPCTEFSVAKSDSPRDFESALKVVDACLKIIWECRIKNKFRFWAMENPRGFLRQFLGVPHYTFEQWQFDEKAVKSTDIWGYFNEPSSTVKVKPAGLTRRFPCGSTNSIVWETPSIPEEYKNMNLSRAALRAITPSGFAEAFYRANK